VTRPRKHKTPAHQSPAQRRPPAARRPGPPDPHFQPGRRPTSPAFLLLLALTWIAAGVVDLVALDASWKLIPGIVFVGIGLLFLRGAAVTVVRRAERGR
jgi:hypothetical protein